MHVLCNNFLKWWFTVYVPTKKVFIFLISLRKYLFRVRQIKSCVSATPDFCYKSYNFVMSRVQALIYLLKSPSGKNLSPIYSKMNPLANCQNLLFVWCQSTLGCWVERVWAKLHCKKISKTFRFVKGNQLPFPKWIFHQQKDWFHSRFEMNHTVNENFSFSKRIAVHFGMGN